MKLVDKIEVYDTKRSVRLFRCSVSDNETVSLHVNSFGHYFSYHVFKNKEERCNYIFPLTRHQALVLCDKCNIDNDVIFANEALPF